MHSSQLEMVTPCTMDWNTMPGDARRRFCSSCSKHVHDLSEHTEAEALEIVKRPEVCAQYRVGADGSVIFRRGRVARTALLAGALLGMASPAFASGQSTEPGALSRLVGWLRGTAATEETKPNETIAEISSPEALIPELSNPVVSPPPPPQTVPDDMPRMPGGLRFHPIPQEPIVPIVPKRGVR